jgi:hypothetical protein
MKTSRSSQASTQPLSLQLSKSPGSVGSPRKQLLIIEPSPSRAPRSSQRVNKSKKNGKATAAAQLLVFKPSKTPKRRLSDAEYQALMLNRSIPEEQQQDLGSASLFMHNGKAYDSHLYDIVELVKTNSTSLLTTVGQMSLASIGVATSVVSATSESVSKSIACGDASAVSEEIGTEYEAMPWTGHSDGDRSTVCSDDGGTMFSDNGSVFSTSETAASRSEYEESEVKFATRMLEAIKSLKLEDEIIVDESGYEVLEIGEDESTEELMARVMALETDIGGPKYYLIDRDVKRVRVIREDRSVVMSDNVEEENGYEGKLPCRGNVPIRISDTNLFRFPLYIK